MQSKQELEDWYSQADRWGYFQNPDDSVRLQEILFILSLGKEKYKRAIDIGCGEGFITSHIPATEIHGLDLSDNALNRLPHHIKPIDRPEGKYDLVISTGTLYSQYDHEGIYNMIKSCAVEYILIGGISDWLIPKYFGKELQVKEFKYREFTQKLTLYGVETGS